MTPSSFIEGVARFASELRAHPVDDPDGAYTDTLRMLDRDAGDYLVNQWRCESCPDGATEARAVEVLTERIFNLVHYANAAGVEDVIIGGLVMLCVEAVAEDVIVDRHHAAFFEGCHPARN